MASPALLSHYRDAKGLEVDLIVETEHGVVAVEAKSGATIASDFFRSLDRFAPNDDIRRVLVFGGDQAARRSNAKVVAWRNVKDAGCT